MVSKVANKYNIKVVSSSQNYSSAELSALMGIQLLRSDQGVDIRTMPGVKA